MAAKRKIPTTQELTAGLPEAEREAALNRWRGWFEPRLTKETATRKERFFEALKEKHDLIEGLILGHQVRASGPARDFLILMGNTGVPLPEKCREILELRKPPEDTDLVLTAWAMIRDAVAAGDHHFFSEIANFLRNGPSSQGSFVRMVDLIQTAAHSGNHCFNNNAVSRGRNSLQTAAFALLVTKVDSEKRLPSLADLDSALCSLFEKPPAKRERQQAFQALGLDSCL